MREEIAKVRTEIENCRVDVLKWTFFSFYVSTLLGMVALILAVL